MTDGSPVSMKAAKYRIRLAKTEKARRILMHVVEDVKQRIIGLQAKYRNFRLVEGFKRVRTNEAED